MIRRIDLLTSTRLYQPRWEPPPQRLGGAPITDTGPVPSMTETFDPANGYRVKVTGWPTGASR